MKCQFCKENKPHLLFTRGKGKICGVCMSIIIDTIKYYTEVESSGRTLKEE